MPSDLFRGPGSGRGEEWDGVRGDEGWRWDGGGVPKVASIFPITKQYRISDQEGISKKARQVVNGILKSTDSQSQIHCTIGKAT